MQRNESRSTLARLRRCRRVATPKPITMDLLGVGKDGGLYVWQEAAQVQPLSTLAVDARCTIKSGHYVIEWLGAAVTVHLGNLLDGRISVQFMCGGVPMRYERREAIEARLLGRVIPDPKQQAEIIEELRRLTEELQARSTAPHRRRGFLGEMPESGR